MRGSGKVERSVFCGLLVAALMTPLLPFAQELGPGLVGLAEEDDVGDPFQDLRLDSRHGAAYDGHDPA